jgi:ATP-binding cassette subfamily B protein
MQEKTSTQYLPHGISIFVWTLQQLYRFKFYYISALLCLFLLHYSLASLPIMMMQLQKHLPQGTSEILTCLRGYGLIAICVMVFRTGSRWLFFFPARLQQKLLRIELVNHFASNPPFQWQDYTRGKMYQLLVSDLDELRAYIGFALLQLFNIVIALSVLIPAMLSVDASLLWSLLPLFASFLLFTYLLRKSSLRVELGKKSHDYLQQYLIESYDAKNTINTFLKESETLNQFNAYSDAELQFFRESNYLRSWARPILSTGLALSLCFVGYRVIDLEMPKSYLVAYSGFLFLLLEPLAFLTWIGIIYSNTKVSWKRLQDFVLHIQTEIPLKGSLSVTEDNLCLDQTRSFFPKITLKAGERTLLMGETGSGKTTLLHDLFYHLLAAQKKVTFVEQEPVLFNDTLGANILLFEQMDDITTDHLRRLLSLFELNILAENFLELWNLEVGEKGVKLSGGQIKRVHLVRSLLFESEFILWDDPFSSLDVVLEKKIMEELLSSPMLIGKTLVYSSHRYSSMKYAQHVIKLGANFLNAKLPLSALEQQTVQHFFGQQVSHE